jgi:hypothetical protein
MSTKINVRSPFYKKVGNVDLDYATLSLFIYDGVFTTDKPASAQYTLVKRPVNGNNYVVFEIAELVRDYLDTSFDGTYTSQTVWVEADVVLTLTDESVEDDNSDYIAYAGYGYFEDGINPELSRGLLISNKTIYRLDDENIRVPVDTFGTNSVTYFYDGQVKRSKTISTSTNTNAQIEYVSVSGSDDSDNFQERVLADGGTFEFTACLKEFLDTLDIGLVDELWVATDSGVEIVKIISVCEPKYTPYKVTFLNKFGALQDMYFFKKSVESISTNQETYKRSTMDLANLSYSVSSHQASTFNKNGKEKITMNTGFISEDYNEVIRQLLLSEQVWVTKLTDQELVLPLNVVSNSLTYKTNVNDKLIDYTLEFSYAYDKINNIR